MSEDLLKKLPYSDNTFDIIICVDVLEHVANLQQLFQIYRVLKPHGLFFFDTINRNFKSKLVMIWLLENLLRDSCVFMIGKNSSSQKK